MTSTEATASRDPELEELVFLARSRHRVELLLELSTAGRTRRELLEATDVSRPTLGRILGDFERRRWVTNHHDGEYALSPLGVLLADSLTELLDVVDTVTALSGIADHLPWERLGFDRRHLIDCTVTTPSEAEPLAHMRRFDELASSADAVGVLSNVVSCAPSSDSLEADKAFLADIDELVATADALAADLHNEPLRAWLRGCLEDGALVIYRSDEPAEFLLGIFDGTVGIVPIDGTGRPAGLIESRAAPVRDWAVETFEAHKANGTRLEPAELGAQVESTG